MSDYIKKPFGQSLNLTAAKRALDAVQQTGRALPCVVETVVSSGIVTVSFQVNSGFTLQNVTMPIIGSEYVRLPIQVGDKGVTFPADTLLGGLSGLGAGLPNLVQPANLTGLAFMWLGSSAWSVTDDPGAVVIYGPNGVVIRDKGKNCVLTVSPVGATITGDSGDLAVSGNLSAGNGITGSFTTPTGQTVTVQNGIVTNIF